MSLPICPGRLRAGNGAQRKARKQEGVKLKSAMRRRKGKFKLANYIKLVSKVVSQLISKLVSNLLASYFSTSASTLADFAQPAHICGHQKN